MERDKLQLKGLMVITPPVVNNRIEFLGKITAALRGGADLLQLRLKPGNPLEVLRIGRMVADITRNFGVPLIVDDLPEVAIHMGAQGVHVGKEDPSVHWIRERFGDRLIIGATSYCDPTLGLLLEHEGADYLGFSTPFVSRTKVTSPDCPFTKLKELKDKVRIPVFAIGGITLENVGMVLETGVDGVAVCSGIFETSDVEGTTRRFKELLSKATN